MNIKPELRLAFLHGALMAIDMREPPLDEDEKTNLAKQLEEKFEEWYESTKGLFALFGRA